MKNCKAIVCGLLSVFFASAASAGLQNAVTVPWEGDITKFHTAVAGTNIILKGVLESGSVDLTVLGAPDSLTFTWLATSCGAGGTFTFKLNGVTVGTGTIPGNCSCSPGFTTLSVPGATLSSAWGTAASPPNIEVIYSGGLYVSSVAWTLDFGGTPYTSAAFLATGIKGLSDSYLCDGYSSSAFDIIQNLNNVSIPTPVQYQWNPGDGSGFSTMSTVTVTLGTPFPVSLNHTYSGSTGTPYVAWLIASDGTTTISNRYLVMLQASSLDANINIAIDDGLWWLYQNATFSDGSSGAFQTLDGSPCAAWTSYSSEFHASPTAGAVQAFEINGSLQTGNWNQDPYAQAVAYGLNFLLKGWWQNSSWLMLRAVNITTGGTTGEGNPDGNGNGIGIETFDNGGDPYSGTYVPVYQGGAVVDALIASGTPDASTGRQFVSGHTATFKEVVQDMLDQYAWGQYTGTSAFDILTATATPGSPTVTAENGIIGAWRYTWGQAPDNSTAQWAAIASIPAQQSPWNCVVPSFETNYNNNWLWYSYADQNATWGKFGYLSSAVLVGYTLPLGSAETPSGLVQLNADGIHTNDYRWSRVESYFQNNWDTGEAWLSQGIGNGENGVTGAGNFYSIYSFTKSQRTALPNPVVNFPNGFDWYRGNASHDGVATAVSKLLIANSGAWPQTYWEGQELATAWAVIVLNPNLFSAGPVACFSANPNPGFANVAISFDPTCSTDPNPGGIANLVKFDWNWGDGTPDTITTTPDVVPHAFACATLPCSYQVTLTVYDNSNPQLSASAQQTINITQPPHPPVAVPGGPYIVSLCSCDSLTLDGSASFSPDAGLHQENCDTCPPDGITAYGWALTGVPYTYTGSSDEIVSLGNTFTTYFPTADTYNIGLQVTDNAKKSFPSGTTSNLVGDAFTSVTVYNCGPTVTATPGCLSVAVSWNDVGATSYNVLSSTTGPNSGFTVAATVGAGGTSTSIPATLGEVQWIRVQAITGNGTTMSCAKQVTNTFVDCVCISDLNIQTKATIAELQWSLIEGVSSYNVYRSTAPNVSMIPANRVAKGVGTVHGLYVDGDLTNGRTYYYRISAVTDGVETCRSIEVSGMPAAVKR